MYIPVNLSDNVVQVKWSAMSIILVPDILAWVFLGAVTGDSIVDSCHDGEEPGEGRQDLVGQNSSSIVRLTTGEWVVYEVLSVMLDFSSRIASNNIQLAPAIVTDYDLMMLECGSAWTRLLGREDVLAERAG